MAQVKRFPVFAYHCYDAYGGWGDFKDSFDTVEEAQAWVDADLNVHKRQNHDYYDVVDLTTGKKV
jgi:hypothetical protein